MANQEHVDRLKRSVQEWNAWRDQNPEIRPDLSDADLSNTDLFNANLSYAKLRGAKLVETNLIEAKLSDAVMYGANLYRANLNASLLNRANLLKVNLEEASLYEAELVNVNLIEANLYRANLGGSILKGAILTRTKLESADLSRTKLMGANLVEADLTNSDLRFADLSGANLGMANLSGAVISSANLSYADLSRAKFVKTFLNGANLSNSKPIAADFTEAELIEADLSDTDLRDAILIKTNLKGANLENAKLLGAKIVDPDTNIGPRITDVNWEGVNLAVLEPEIAKVKKLSDEDFTRHGKVTPEAEKFKIFEAMRATRQLSTALKNKGLDELATKFVYRSHCHKQRYLWYSMISQNTKILKRLKLLFQYGGSWIMRLIAGFGYSVGLAFLWYVVVILVFGAIYKEGTGADGIQATVASINAFHGRSVSTDISKAISENEGLLIWTGVEAVVGLLIEVTFIAALTQRFFGK